ncbi:hypothetical protein Q8F55_009290 [Vanrija albida]|uniref:Uncharacterized protein n=1 Tax=Vanrija albida TaxID=181172 RepID=A0ABR3PT79_9TREE
MAVSGDFPPHIIIRYSPDKVDDVDVDWRFLAAGGDERQVAARLAWWGKVMTSRLGDDEKAWKIHSTPFEPACHGDVYVVGAEVGALKPGDFIMSDWLKGELASDRTPGLRREAADSVQ